MSRFDPPLPAIDEIRQANRLFLGYLRSRPEAGAGQLGLTAAATGLLKRASPRQIERAADFPRALFRLRLPPAAGGAVMDPLGFAQESGRRVLGVTLLLCAWNLSRTSAYSARVLLRLDDADIRRFRTAEMAEILAMSGSDDVVCAAFDDLDWIWPVLLTETRPEQRRRLLLIGLQPDFMPRPLPGML